MTCDYALGSSHRLAADDDTMCPECARSHMEPDPLLAKVGRQHVYLHGSRADLPLGPHLVRANTTAPAFALLGDDVEMVALAEGFRAPFLRYWM
jgi:hypothetical protein